MANKKWSPMRWTAATEEAAVAGALEIIGAAREDADYEVLETGAKGVTVRVKPREESAPVAEQLPVDEADSGEDASQSFVDEDDSSPLPFEAVATDDDVTAELEIADEMAGEGFAENSETPEPQLESEAEELESQFELDADSDSPDFVDEDGNDDSQGADESASRVDEETEEFAPIDAELVARAHGTAQQFLEKMGLDATVSDSPDAPPGTLGITVEGDDVGILIGKHGATLQAFQYLVNLTVNNGVAPESGVRVVINAGNYRARRQNSLEQTARMAAQRARMSGRPVRLDPMPSSERRIVHAFLQTEVGVSTQSEGREPQRRIVVFPAETRQDGTLRTERSSDGFERAGGGRGMGGYNRGRGGRSSRR